MENNIAAVRLWRNGFFLPHIFFEDNFAPSFIYGIVPPLRRYRSEYERRDQGVIPVL
ncbi:hypothetical protein [Chitinophaga pinensis]|uniref:hypothetical protein n=1 Tax=Chitinophaga pinensis TaxID=79329 RepID=UPI00164781C5|nr:hypothetical protein [Chitinophaga pinensis]